MEVSKDSFHIRDYLETFTRKTEEGEELPPPQIVEKRWNSLTIPQYISEYWTSKQRQASSLHEISYRACFKGQLPKFFISLLTQEGDFVYDPFGGRGTTAIEAALNRRNIVSNDANPLSKLLLYPRFFIPTLSEVQKRLKAIPVIEDLKAKIDLSMFYHPKTEGEIVSLRKYLRERKNRGEEDPLDSWIRMVATNRLTGHSKGFFSVYTLPPNQAVTQERQKKINEKRSQEPEYRNIKKRIIKKTKSLTRDVDKRGKENLLKAGKNSLILNKDARNTPEIQSEMIQLTVTSPPFLDVVDYVGDNWLRCWFNNIALEEIEEKITMSSTIEEWCEVMGEVFEELFRITKEGGWVAFEVGEVKRGKIKLEDHVVPMGIEAGFRCEGILVNQQDFTKTSNIWGVNNNQKGTNSNRIVLFQKKG